MGNPWTLHIGNTVYYYVTNIQGDVIAILNQAGDILVAYTYDAWGNPLTTTGTMATTLGVLNPLRYRGYVYDQETHLYYLQSRYYNPAYGRFINADVLVSTGQGLLGNNMFAYCNNNPVNFADRNGKDPYTLFKTWTGSMWWLCAADLALPIGEVIYVAGMLVLGVYVLIIADNVAMPQITLEEDPKATEPEPPDVTYPGDDPTKAPDGYEWRGPDEPGGKRGGYANPNGKDSWHPDLEHPDGIPPHWDYNDGYNHKWRVFPDHIEFVCR